MKWLDRLLSRQLPPSADEHRELEALHSKWTRVQRRTQRLEQELVRVNAELRRKAQLR